MRLSSDYVIDPERTSITGNVEFNEKGKMIKADYPIGEVKMNKVVHVSITQELARVIPVKTVDYEEVDGKPSFKNTQLDLAYLDDGHLTALDLIDELKELVDDLLSVAEEGQTVTMTPMKIGKLKSLRDECEGWVSFIEVYGEDHQPVV